MKDMFSWKTQLKRILCSWILVGSENSSYTSWSRKAQEEKTGSMAPPPAGEISRGAGSVIWPATRSRQTPLCCHIGGCLSNGAGDNMPIGISPAFSRRCLWLPCVKTGEEGMSGGGGDISVDTARSEGWGCVLRKAHCTLKL